MRYRNVLHIDDDEDDREIFFTALRQFTDEVDYTGMDNGIDALQKLSDGTVAPDIIFLDLNMPEMNGRQFLEELYKNGLQNNIPVVVLSTSAHQPTVFLLKKLGAHDFITKPDNFEELGNKLRNILI